MTRLDQGLFSHSRGNKVDLSTVRQNFVSFKHSLFSIGTSDEKSRNLLKFTLTSFAQNCILLLNYFIKFVFSPNYLNTSYYAAGESGTVSSCSCSSFLQKFLPLLKWKDTPISNQLTTISFLLISPVFYHMMHIHVPDFFLSYDNILLFTFFIYTLLLFHFRFVHLY